MTRRGVQKLENDNMHRHRFLSREEHRDATEHARDCMRKFVETMKREKAAQEERERRMKMRMIVAQQERERMIAVHEHRERMVKMITERVLERVKKLDEASTSKPAVDYRPPVYLYSKEEDMAKEARELTFHVPL